MKTNKSTTTINYAGTWAEGVSRLTATLVFALAAGAFVLSYSNL